MNKFVVFAFLLSLLGFSTVIFSQMALASTQVGGQTNGYSCDGNQTNRWKTTNEGENSVTLPSGDIVATIDVKAGDNCVPVYPTNSASTCYSVVVNSNTATVTKIGSGSSCKDISHLEGTFSVQATPTPTTAPTATPTPTVIPTATPTPTTAPTPTTDPCANDNCVTPTITVTPTATPTATVTPTDTPTPTSTPCTSNCGGSNNDNNSGGGNSNNNSSQPTQAVLAASTMASTGTFTTTLMNLMLITGMMVLALGGASYAKEKNH